MVPEPWGWGQYSRSGRAAFAYRPDQACADLPLPRGSVMGSGGSPTAGCSGTIRRSGCGGCCGRRASRCGRSGRGRWPRWTGGRPSGCRSSPGGIRCRRRCRQVQRQVEVGGVRSGAAVRVGAPAEPGVEGAGAVVVPEDVEDGPGETRRAPGPEAGAVQGAADAGAPVAGVDVELVEGDGLTGGGRRGGGRRPRRPPCRAGRRRARGCRPGPGRVTRRRRRRARSATTSKGVSGNRARW